MQEPSLGLYRDVCTTIPGSLRNIGRLGKFALSVGYAKIVDPVFVVYILPAQLTWRKSSTRARPSDRKIPSIPWLQALNMAELNAANLSNPSLDVVKSVARTANDPSSQLAARHSENESNQDKLGDSDKFPPLAIFWQRTIEQNEASFRPGT